MNVLGNVDSPFLLHIHHLRPCESEDECCILREGHRGGEARLSGRVTCDPVAAPLLPQPRHGSQGLLPIPIAWGPGLPWCTVTPQKEFYSQLLQPRVLVSLAEGPQPGALCTVLVGSVAKGHGAWG